MRWHYRDGALLWLFPPAYAVHVLEELFAGEGFPAWLARIVGSPVPVEAFILVNLVGMVLLLAAVRRATRDERAGWMAIAIATIAALNGTVHLLGTLVTGRYSPGLISGVVLYLPLGALTLLRAAYQADPGTVTRGVWAGVAVHAAVFVVAFLLSRA
jgi:hypothetical protein